MFNFRAKIHICDPLTSSIAPDSTGAWLVVIVSALLYTLITAGRQYRCIGFLTAVKSRFAPSCLDEDVCCERLFDGVNLSHFDENDLNEDRPLGLHNDNDSVM